MMQAPAPVARIEASAGGGGAMALAAEPLPLDDGQPTSFEALLARLEALRETVLVVELERHVHLVSFEPGRIVLSPLPRAAQDLGRRLLEAVQGHFGEHWQVEMVRGGAVSGAETLDEARRRRAQEALKAVEAEPAVQAALTAFPGAKVLDIRTPGTDGGGTVVQFGKPK
jgi:DNA polymerase-3 subunit gamma/tau